MYWACQDHTNLMNTSHQQHRTQWAGIALLGLCCAMIGWLGGFAWVHRATIGDLWFQASEQKYSVMTGQVGPVTYLVTHTNYQAMEAFALEHDEVLGVEVYELPNKAAVAFTQAESVSIATLSDAEFVVTMNQQIIPMMCH